jgi:hypothetical protein|eukprot:COSAG02_NODE_421_length_22605_cov_158.841198_3_plen_58_part_00
MTATVTPVGGSPDYAAEQDRETDKLHEGMDYCREDGRHTWVRTLLATSLQCGMRVSC